MFREYQDRDFILNHKILLRNMWADSEQTVTFSISLPLGYLESDGDSGGMQLKVAW